jgi:hypothetical protein
MYVITRERLGLIPPPFSFFLLPPKIQVFLDKVRKDPKSFEPLLLTMELHPDPLNLDLGPGRDLTDLILMNSPASTSAAVGKTVLGLLKAILNQYKQDPRFRRQVESEYNLASQVQQTTGKLPRQKLEPFLFNAWLEPDINLTRVGRDFATQMLPALRQAMIQSKVPNTHFFNVGRFLQKLFEALLKEPAFRRRYETELENRTMAATKEFLRKSPVTAKPFLLEAALSSEASQGQVGKSFAAKILPGFTPSRLYDRLLNSDVAEGVFMRLEIYLKVAADVERTTDRAFDRLVKEEMKRRQLKRKREQ